MTHLIKNWPLHGQRVSALQTTKNFDVFTDFCIHPGHQHTDYLERLEQQFNLPHLPRCMKQVHSNQIIEYLTPPTQHMQQQADACFTRKPGIICAVMTADCLPVLLTDKQNSFVAAIHCGWRSLYTGILSRSLELIKPAGEVLAWFGPCIQQQQYEVGADFVATFISEHPASASAFTPIKAGKSHADLYQIAKQQLETCDITAIKATNECTYLNHQYHSWRQNKTPHRMASMIWLNTDQ